MAADKEYIERGSIYRRVKTHTNPYGKPTLDYESGVKVLDMIKQEPAADVVEVEKVAEMLRAMFDDDCACNYNGNDEWLPHVCDYGRTECPDAPEANGCWKQFVKHFLAKMDGERK